MSKRGNKVQKVDVLGTIYTIEYRTKEEDEKLKQVAGYCDYSIKKIVCNKRTEKDKDDLDLSNLGFVDNRILRHEIIHAFIYESGLWCNSFGISSWADNEEMTDWFAIQFPKIYKVYAKLGILD